MSQACEMPASNVPEAEIRELLESAHSIAIVGLSEKPHRDSYRVAAYLKNAGYQIIPVNPRVQQVLGERSYPSLRDVPGPVDIVNVFRKPEAVLEIVSEAIAIGAKSIWTQLGIAHNKSADEARAAGLKVVMNKCIMIEHARLV